MSTKESSLAIGAVASRTGVAVSAIRFYEEQGLIEATRESSGHRRFERSPPHTRDHGSRQRYYRHQNGLNFAAKFFC